MIDMSQVMIAKSDQINAADLLGGSVTIQIAGVKLTGKEQATEIKIVGEDKVWRPCKTTVRIMSRAWGNDGEKWAGKWATLYCDPTVRFGKDKPGGIRISHLSDINGKLDICLQASKGVLKTYEIEPLATQQAPTAEQWADAQITKAANASADWLDKLMASSGVLKLKDSDKAQYDRIGEAVEKRRDELLVAAAEAAVEQ